ncbi:MAG: radical SAM/SPASM domain-containing protein, partial [Nitrospinota bacterium]
MNGKKRADIRNVFQIEKEKFLSLADTAAALDVEQISIVGISEPFMHKEILLFISWIKERSMRCMVTTNGSMLNRDVSRQIVDSRLDILNVSVNAATEQTYEKLHGKGKGRLFVPLQEKISYLSDIRQNGDGLQLNLRYVITSENLEELEDFVKFAIDTGVDRIVLQHCSAPSFALELALLDREKRRVAEILNKVKNGAVNAGLQSNIDYIIAMYSGAHSDDSSYRGVNIDNSYYDSNPCYVAWTYTMIMENGDVMPCCYCRTPVGNINDAAFDEIWFGNEYNSLRKKLKNLPAHPDEPQGCHCFSGCGAVSDNIRTVERLGLS